MHDDDLPEISTGTFCFDVTIGTDVGPLAVRWGTREHHRSDAPLEYGSQRYAVLRYCFEGEGTFTSGGQAWPIRAGTVCWHGRGSEITLAAKTPELRGYAILLYGDELDALWRSHLPTVAGAFALDRPAPVRRLMEAIMAEGLTAGDGREASAVALSRVLLQRIDNAITAADPGTAVSRQTHQRLRQHIEENFATIHALPEVSAKCGVSVPYLCRVFERFDTVSPYELLTDLKIAHAERLLLEGGQSVADVALAVGYPDAKLFSRKFKATYGASPRAYRRSTAGAAATR